MSDPVLIAGAVVLAAGFAVTSRAAATAEASISPLLPPLPEAPDGTRSAPDHRLLAIGLGSLGFAVGSLLVGPVGAVLAAAAGLAAPTLARRRGMRRRSQQLQEDLADAVTAVAAAMRAGLSLPQSIAYAAEEVEEPLAGTLRRTVGRSELGEPLNEALLRWSEEVGGDDARLLVGVLSLHRRTGGDLPLVLDRVAVTLRERRAATREVRALTAQARLSGGILGALPAAFFLFLMVTSRNDVRAAFGSSAGRAALVLGIVMEGGAFIWIRRLLRVV
jgi:tight adherence protein B